MRKIVPPLPFLLLIFSISSVHAQKYYPGGLGNTSLVIWLDANSSSSITKNGSAQVSQWSNLSGTGYNFTQGTTGNMPVYGATSGPNSMPALSFTAGSSQYLANTSIPSTVSWTSGVTSMAIANFHTSQTTQGWERIYDFGQGSQSDNIWFGRKNNSDDFGYEAWNGTSGDQTYTTTTPIIDGSNVMYEAVQAAGSVGNTTAVSFYTGGTSQTSTGQAGSSVTYVPTAVTRTKNYIGRSNWTADNYFWGTMSEILMYKTAMNTTSRVILENYYAAKWGMTVAVSKYTNPSSGTYGTNLVGIGYTSASDNFLTDVTGSTDGLGFSSGTGATGFLHSAGYLMAAHNGQTNSILSPATIPGITSSSGTLGRFNRSWYVQKTGGTSTGSVTINFNFDDYRGSTPTSTYTYALLYNATDGSFATGTNVLVSTTGTSVSGNVVALTATASNLSNGYYTLVWTTNGTLPVTLDSWTATRNGSEALLEWSQTLESGSHRYAIQRSTDGTNWATIGVVTSAAAATNADTHYSYTDENPAAGLDYYRLQITDADGSSGYSTIKTLDFTTGKLASLSIYPNPCSGMLHIDLSILSGETVISLYNTLGQRVIQSKATAPTLTELSVNNLPNGIYTLVVQTGVSRYTEKLLKN